MAEFDSAAYLANKSKTPAKDAGVFDPAAYLAKKTASTISPAVSSTTSTNTPPKAPGYMARVQEDVSRGIENIAETGKMIQSDTSRKVIGLDGTEVSIGGGIGEKAAAGAIRLASDVVNIAAAPVVEGLVSLFNGVVSPTLSAITPTFIKEGASNLALKAIDTEAGRQGIAALNSGIDTYREWAKTNPNDAKLIGSVINLAPFGKAANQAAPAVSRGLFTNITSNLDSAAAKQAVGNRISFLQELTTPELTKATREQLKGQSIETGGILRGQKVIPKAEQEEIIKVLNAVPEVNTGRTLLGNQNAIKDAISKEAQSLVRQLEQPINALTPAPTISRQEIERASKKAVNLASQIQYPTGDSVEITENMARKMRALITEKMALGTMSDSNALLAARKEFDSWATSFKNDIFEGGATKAEDAARQVRESINELIASKNPNVDVNGSLNKQAKLFAASDILLPKVGPEATNVIGRTWQKISGLPGVRSKLNSILGIATGSGVLGATAIFAPAISIGLGGVAALTIAGKALSSAQAKTVLSFMLKELDKPIRSSKVARDIVALQLSKKTIEELINTIDMQDQQNPNAVQSQIPSGQPAFVAPLAAPVTQPLPGPVAQTSPQDMPFNALQGTGIAQALRPQEAYRQAMTGIGGR